MGNRSSGPCGGGAKDVVVSPASEASSPPSSALSAAEVPPSPDMSSAPIMGASRAQPTPMVHVHEPDEVKKETLVRDERGKM